MEIKAKVIHPELIGNKLFDFLNDPSFSKFNNSKFTILPGFCDVHVHFREPGFSYKETIKTGSMAAAHGGYTTVLTMPNLKPVSDTIEHIQEQLSIIHSDSVINVIPYGSITIDQKGEELSPLDDIANLVVAFSDDGHGVQSEAMMFEAMKKAKSLNKIITAHCEVNALLNEGYIHDGKYCHEHNHKGICSASEYEQIKRDVELAKLTGCKYHVCHISTKESVEIIRKAKLEGVDVTCETAPHYLLLCDEDLQESGNYKMNPPLRSKEDQKALLEGIKDGTIDMIATDHAPHSEEEKCRGLKDSLFGIVGLETAFPLLYTYLVKTNVISLDRLIELMVINPKKRFNLSYNTDFSIWDLEKKTKIDPSTFISKGKSTPFIDKEVWGLNCLTIHNSKVVYKN